MKLNKKKKQGIYMMIGSILLAGAAFASIDRDKVLPQPNEADFAIGEKKFDLEKLSTEEERNLGLSGRESLTEGHGLLFVFDVEGKYGFWMKDMNFPISIIWLDSDCKVTGFKKLATADSYPEVFYPENPSSYAVEVNPINTDLTLGTTLSCNFI